jgi:hypothetical protein
VLIYVERAFFSSIQSIVHYCTVLISAALEHFTDLIVSFIFIFSESLWGVVKHIRITTVVVIFVFIVLVVFVSGGGVVVVIIFSGVVFAVVFVVFILGLPLSAVIQAF